MRYQKSSSYLVTLSVALGVALVPFTFMTPQLNAQQLYAKLSFPRTPVGAPRITVGGGTRSSGPSCGVSKKSPLIVLSPQNNVVTTVSAQPTLFWYVPKTSAKSAEFVVYDNGGQTLYQTTLALTGTPGVVKLSLPPTVALETNKKYDWTFALKCNPNPNQNSADVRIQDADDMVQAPDVMVKGSLKRTVLTSTQKSQLAAAKQPLKQAEVYAKAGVWQETLSILAQLRRDRPSDRDVNAAWKELLESVDLKNIASEPLVECCRADK